MNIFYTVDADRFPDYSTLIESLWLILFEMFVDESLIGPILLWELIKGTG